MHQHDSMHAVPLQSCFSLNFKSQFLTDLCINATAPISGSGTMPVLGKSSWNAPCVLMLSTAARRQRGVCSLKSST
jgi:hypothetical protein